MRWRDRVGGALCAANVPRPREGASSFISLRRAPHRPDPSLPWVFEAAKTKAGPRDMDAGWPMQRNKGGGALPAPGDIRCIGHPASVSRAKPSAHNLTGREHSDLK